eukprot:COSAG02_NODE_4615_length_5161_cov_10.381865_5_plen_99_part_00
MSFAKEQARGSAFPLSGLNQCFSASFIFPKISRALPGISIARSLRSSGSAKISNRQPTLQSLCGLSFFQQSCPCEGFDPALIKYVQCSVEFFAKVSHG